MLKYPKCAASAKRQRAAWDKMHEVRAGRLSSACLCWRRQQELDMNALPACGWVCSLPRSGDVFFLHQQANLGFPPFLRHKRLPSEACLIILSKRVTFQSMMDCHSINIYTIDARSTNVTGGNHEEAGAPLRFGDVVCRVLGSCLCARASAQESEHARACPPSLLFPSRLCPLRCPAFACVGCLLNPVAYFGLPRTLWRAVRKEQGGR